MTCTNSFKEKYRFLQLNFYLFCLFSLFPFASITAAGNNFTILAANDLGMHCADQDYRIFSILPPYNVINAQVLQKGSRPTLMSPADGIHVTYKAAQSNYFSDFSNPPNASDSLTSTGTNLNGVFKNNFWETVKSKSAVTVLLGSSFFTIPLPPSANGINKLGYIAYESLYPPKILSLFPSTTDLGLPAPDVARLYLGDKTLHAEQSAMPGSANTAQRFNNYIEDFPFFINFPFGYTVNNFKRYTAEGIPISPIDDSGRINPYPLMRIEARNSANNEVLASVDTVLPVSSEADCKSCHASQEVCNIDSSDSQICTDIANDNYQLPFISNSSEALNVIGANAKQKVINSAKINILRLHDHKNGTSLAGSSTDGSNANGTTPDVVCASCHYSPALDLAHLGPNDSNGKEQTQHVSMSRAMHSFHGKLPQQNSQDYGNLFPIMPPPGASRNAAAAQQLLMETCYNCHPGKNAKCLRGAMGGSGTVCQDCHGQMTQIGDDFTEDFPNNHFPAGADLTKRVPWASEPACDSCHVGDVIQKKALADSSQLNDHIINSIDSHGNTDNLRLLLAYKESDHKANGGADKLEQLSFPNSRFATTESLYRLSGARNGNKGTGIEKGHGGLSCENCHGSTHAIWPNKNPSSNDNKAAMDIQGHTGTIVECSACHTGDLGITLGGPHGMHPVGDTLYADGGHGPLARQNGDTCRACHGLNGEGSVLSRVAKDRTINTSSYGAISLSKGDLVKCNLCHHENRL